MDMLNHPPIKDGTPTEMILRIDKEGKIGLPKQLLEQTGMRIGSEVLVKAENGSIVLIPTTHGSPLLATFKQKMEARLKEAGLTDTDPFFGALTMDEYAALSEAEAEALWEKLDIEANRKVKYKEMEVGTDYVPAGQKANTSYKIQDTELAPTTEGKHNRNSVKRLYQMQDSIRRS